MFPSLILFAAILAVPATQPAAAPAVLPATEAAVRSALASRLAVLGKARIAYDVTIDFPLTDSDRKTAVVDDNQGHVAIRNNGSYRYAERLSLLDGRSRLDSQLVEHVPLVAEPPTLRAVGRSYVFAPDRAQKLELYGPLQGDWQTAKGWKRNRAGLQPSWLEVALGLRALRDSSSRLTDANYRAMKLVEDGPDRVRLVAKDDFWIITWVLDRRYGYAPVAYSLRYRPGNYLIAEMTMADFRAVGDWQFPYSIKCRSFQRLYQGAMRVTDSEELAIKEYRFNSPENNPDLYWIDWPEGTIVRDESANVDLVARNGVLRPAGR